MIQEEKELLTALLKEIAAAHSPPEEERYPNRFSIIAGLCAKKCRELKEFGAPTQEIVEQSSDYMKKLEAAFPKLEEPPAKIKPGDGLKLTDEGRRFLEEVLTQKIPD